MTQIIFVRKMTSFFSILFFICLAGCSNSDSNTPNSGNAPNQQSGGNGFKDPRPTLTGPSLVGHWASACAANSQIVPQIITPTPPFRQFEFVITVSGISRITKFFEDSNCTNETLRLAYHGKYRFIDQFSDNSYLTEYAFEMGEADMVYPQEKILVGINQFFISNLDSATEAPILNAEPLAFIGP